jgi:WhiB family transcriptional regulator, redox-sensing transcriptional regulator
MTTNWRDRAACHDADPVIFFPVSRGGTAAVATMCGDCPVRGDCLEEELAKGLSEQHGWFGGLPPAARKQIIRSRRRRAADNPGVMGRLYQLCLDGKQPAEALPAYLRERLVTRLHAQGWTDLDIAVHTYMTLYTTVRIRERLGLSANTNQKGAA